MPRQFIDSLSPRAESLLYLILQTGKHLGFSELWISNPTKEEKEVIKSKTFSNLLRIFIRLDIGLNNESKKELTNILRKQRRTTPIIAVTCENSEIAAWAAQDNRVDILRFPIFQTAQLMTRSIAKLMIKFQKHLEIPLSNLYSLPERQQIPALRHIRSALEIATHKNIPIILSSGADRADQMRSPRDLASLGQILLSSSHLALDNLSTIPLSLRELNLKKISSNYIAPGVFRRSITSLEQSLEEE